MNKKRFWTALTAVLMLFISTYAEENITLANVFGRPLQWCVGVETSPAFVPGTTAFLKGTNPKNSAVHNSLSGTLRTNFSFDKNSHDGSLYTNVYQGIGIGALSFFHHNLMGTPISAHVFQGAPILHLNNRLWLGYEWKFGAAMGWKKYDVNTAGSNAPVSTSVTAHMAFGLRLNYSLSANWLMTLGIEASHYSNGNTSIPNAGVNSIGAIAGVSYLLNAPKEKKHHSKFEPDTDNHTKWFYDIMVYGSWRKKVVCVGSNDDIPQIIPGRFGVLGFQFSPMRKLNQWIATGVALDVQYDESAGIAPYWVEGSFHDNVKFYRPPFIKQLSTGLSAHAELIMPIFAINAGLGFDILNPKGNKRFYQSLTLKTFVVRNVYLNVGYRLGNFNDPQNLMLGLGIRL